MRWSAGLVHTHRMALPSVRFRDPRSTEYDFISSIMPACG
jgi:hypothetical protein